MGNLICRNRVSQSVAKFDQTMTEREDIRYLCVDRSQCPVPYLYVLYCVGMFCLEGHSGMYWLGGLNSCCHTVEMLHDRLGMIK